MLPSENLFCAKMGVMENNRSKAINIEDFLFMFSAVYDYVQQQQDAANYPISCLEKQLRINTLLTYFSDGSFAAFPSFSSAAPAFVPSAPAILI